METEKKTLCRHPFWPCYKIIEHLTLYLGSKSTLVAMATRSCDMVVAPMDITIISKCEVILTLVREVVGIIQLVSKFGNCCLGEL